MTDLERIIADLRADGAADTLYAPERMTYYADRLAALAGAAPVAYMRAMSPLGVSFHLQPPGTPLFTHAPAKAREDAARLPALWERAASVTIGNDDASEAQRNALQMCADHLRAALATFAEGKE